MKNYTLKDQYKLSLKCLSVFMPLSATFLIIAGIIILIIINTIWWVGLIFVGIALLILIEFYFIRRYLNKMILKCESEARK